MQAKLTELNQRGLRVFLAGQPYNFRAASIGDQEVALQMQAALLAGEFGSAPLFSGRQVHGRKVVDVNQTSGQAYSIGKIFEETDGLMTNQPHQVLLVKFADCTPIILYDSVQQAVAVLHSGWRSTVLKISQQAIQQMQVNYGSQLQDLVAYVGPSIDANNYEVGEEVAQAFRDAHLVGDFLAPGRESGKYQLSMIGANQAILEEVGLSPDQILVETTSTFTSPYLHSARQEGKEYGLNALLVMLEGK